MQTKWLALFALISIFTGVGGYWLGQNFIGGVDSELFSQKPLTPIENKETMSAEAAQQQRDEHYQSVSSITEVLSLPSLFSQQEALHAVAGRADKKQLKKLLKQAASIANAAQRESLLQILVARLTEIDPITAANIAKKAYENKNYTLLTQVYLHWAKLDIEGAINSANKH